MALDETLREVMALALQVPVEAVGPEASMDHLAAWTSLRHLSLILAVEEAFGVQLPEEEAAYLSSFALLREALRELGVPE